MFLWGLFLVCFVAVMINKCIEGDVMAKHTIEYTKISGHQTEINTIFCKLSKLDKDVLIDILEDALYIITEAQHEIDIVNKFQREEVPPLGKGKFLKNKKHIGVTAALSGTVYQLKNIEILLECFRIINKHLKANKWPETIYAPEIVFKDVTA